MKLLLIKTSSLGDLLHTFPAITDAAMQDPTLEVDWVVEEAFADIPVWHPHVKDVIPIAIRRWRKQPWHSWRSGEISRFKQRIAQGQYDLIIDAQGLLKSAWIGRCNSAPYVGLDKASIKESWASYFYHRKITVPKGQHAVERTRQLFAQAFGYAIPETLNYGIDKKQFLDNVASSKPYLIFLHGTTWESKHWPDSYWCELMAIAAQEHWQVKLPWSNPAEQQRALLIQKQFPDYCEVLPKMRLRELVSVIAGASAVVSVDSGLGHMATALNVPTLGLYGPTRADLTGICGAQQQSLTVEYPCAPCLKKVCPKPAVNGISPACFTHLPPQQVWHQLVFLLSLDSKK